MRRRIPAAAWWMVMACGGQSGSEQCIVSHDIVYVSPDLRDLGVVAPGDAVEADVHVSADREYTVTDVILEGDAAFSLATALPLDVGPDAAGQIVVTFAPTEAGLYTADLTVVTDAADTCEATVFLRGVAADPAAADPGDADADGVTADDGDCDDEDPWAAPDTLEWCDGSDNDCDGEVDEGCLEAAVVDCDPTNDGPSECPDS